VPDAIIEAAQQPPDGGPFAGVFANLADVIRTRAETAPDQTFLITYDADGQRQAHTFAAFAARVRRVAGCLAGKGVTRGDRVATILHNHHEAVFLMFATWWLGAALVPINIEEPPARKRFILDNARACLLFTLPEYRPEVQAQVGELPLLREVVVVDDQLESGIDEAPPGAHLTDEALIVYTSGTTGNPKGVVLNQYNLLADADAIARWFHLAPGERWMCVLPIHHVNGIVVTLLSPLYAGAGVVLNRRFSTRTFWERATAEGVAVSSLVPTLLEFLLEAGEEFGRPPATMRGVICGAGPLAVETVMRFEQTFAIPVWHGYGLSETTAYACMTPLDLPTDVRRRWYSTHGFPMIGAAMPHQGLSIRGSDGAELAAGVRGEICLRGSTIMQGYYQRPDANAEAFKYPGWFRSGDEGFWLPAEDGRHFFFITGRLKELIIRGGVNLSPMEIDAVLTQHPAVRFGMAVPFANRIYGEEVAAYVVPRDGHTPSDTLAAEIRASCAARLPFPMQPKVVLFGTDVPYTSTGKPKRLVLKALLAEQLQEYHDVQFREGNRHAGR
jgi:long-chain acyl-CoA synthetase